MPCNYFFSLADTGKGTVAKPEGAADDRDGGLADTGKGTVAKHGDKSLNISISLADTGKGTVAKQMWGIVRQYIGLCQVFATELRSDCAMEGDFKGPPRGVCPRGGVVVGVWMGCQRSGWRCSARIG